MKKVFCILLAVVMLFSLTSCGGAGVQPLKIDRTEEFSLYNIPAKFNDHFAAQFAPVNFAAVCEYSCEDIAPLKEALARMTELCGQKGTLEELQELYQFCYQEYVNLQTAEVAASVQYDIFVNSNSRKERSLQASALASEAETLYESTMQTVLSSQYKKEMTAFMGEDVAALFDSDVEDYQHLAQLLKQEDELLKRYNQRAAQPGFSAEKKGFDLAGIFLELVAVRKEIAEAYGYQSAAEYYYHKVYSRDYTPEEAAQPHQDVKQHIVPVYKRISTLSLETDAVVDTETVIPTMQQYIPKISEEMAEILDYMVENEMYFLADPTRSCMGGAYTTRLVGFAQPFIYNGYGSTTYKALTDTVHEFGHYCDAYLNGIYGAKTPGWIFDLAEVCSTGLEMLFYPYYDEIFEGSAADEKTALIAKSLEVIVQGCLFDEAQQKIYDYEGELSIGVVNEIFRQTAEEYGLPVKGGKYFWTTNLHNFRYPFYYLSYAVAYSTSAELWLMAQTRGQQAAVDTYLEMLSIGSFEYSYSRVMKTCGMKGFGSERMLKQLARQIDSEVAALQAAHLQTP